MSTDQLWHLYAAAHNACNPGARRLPKPRAIQQLVQPGESYESAYWFSVESEPSSKECPEI